MVSSQLPSFPEKGHDPDTRQKWSWEFELAAGRSIRVVTVTLVDGSDEPIVGSDLVIDTVTFGLLDGATNKWGVSFFAQGGLSFITTTLVNGSPVSVGSRALIRYRFWFDDNLDDTTASADSTVRLPIEQT